MTTIRLVTLCLLLACAVAVVALPESRPMTVFIAPLPTALVVEWLQRYRGRNRS